MNDRFARNGTIVWILICSLTIISTYLGVHNSPVSLLDVQVLPIAVLALAMIKVRLVIMHFMEIAHAPLPLRLTFEFWIIGVFVILLVMFLMGSRGLSA